MYSRFMERQLREKEEQKTNCKCIPFANDAGSPMILKAFPSTSRAARKRIGLPDQCVVSCPTTPSPRAQIETLGDMLTRGIAGGRSDCAVDATAIKKNATFHIFPRPVPPNLSYTRLPSEPREIIRLDYSVPVVLLINALLDAR